MSYKGLAFSGRRNKGLEEGHPVEVYYMDFKKAFGSVN